MLDQVTAKPYSFDLQNSCCLHPYPQGRSQGGARGGDRPPNRKKNHSLKKAKFVEKWGGGGTRYIPEAETD